MPPNVQSAAKVLGFTQQIWDENGKTPHFDKDWDDLTTEQQNAAITLGYKSATWCQDFDEFEDELREDYSELDWEELPANVQQAAGVLGFTQDAWDNDQRTPNYDKDWTELTQQQQQAAITLGYDRDKWCAEEQIADSGGN